MENTILIPTDFTVQSLNLLKEAMLKTKHEKVRVILVHGVNLSDSITDLLFFSKSKLIKKLETKEFKDSCLFMQNRFSSKLASIYVDIFTGVTQSAFEQYLAGNKIDEAYIPSQTTFNSKNSSSFDIVPYIQNSDLKTHVIDIENEKESTWKEMDQLATLFFNTSHS